MSHRRHEPIDETDTRSVSPSRLTVAREFRALTRKELAEMVGVTPSAITRFETSDCGIENQRAERLSGALDFPIDFFFAEEISHVDEESLTFRARRSMTSALRSKAKAVATIAASVVHPWIRQRYKFPTVDIPNLAGEAPEVAASILRAEWRLSAGPIPNLTRLIEVRGIDIFWMNEPASSVDAFSFWLNDQPFIILNNNKPYGDRARFNIAHELGHMVLHRDVSRSDERTVELEANKFAGAFLLPDSDFHAECPKYPILPDFFKLKDRWGVSAAAMLVRARDLDILSPWQYQTAWKEMAVRKWRLCEPYPIKCETSYLQDKLFAMMHSKGMRPRDLADELKLRYPDLTNLMPVAANYEFSPAFPPSDYDLSRLDIPGDERTLA